MNEALETPLAPSSVEESQIHATLEEHRTHLRRRGVHLAPQLRTAIAVDQVLEAYRTALSDLERREHRKDRELERERAAAGELRSHLACFKDALRNALLSIAEFAKGKPGHKELVELLTGHPLRDENALEYLPAGTEVRAGTWAIVRRPVVKQ